MSDTTTSLYEFDLCTQVGRHTLRVEDLETTRQTLLSWGALSLPLESVLGIAAGESATLPLGPGRSSTVRRVR